MKKNNEANPLVLFAFGKKETNLKFGFKLSSYVALLLFLSLIGYQNVSAATIVSNAVTGNWSTKGSWVGNVVPTSTDDVVIVSGANITMQGNTSMNNLTINSGGILTDNGAGTITILGDITINGTWAGSSSIVLSGANKNIDGAGAISNTGTLTITGNKTVLNSSSLIKGTGSVTLSANTTITNNGSITFGGTVNGVNDITSIWINATNSTLNVGDALLGTGSLDATASGNTINYYSSAFQTIKRTNLSSFTYWHLSISGDASATKAFAAFSYIINGNLTINSTLAGSSSASTTSITLKGNWINTGGTFVANSASVTFSGSTSQTLSSVSGDTFYDLTINNSAGVIVDNNIIVADNLTMTAGNIDVGTNTLTLGTSTSSVGTLIHSASISSGPTIIGKFERWISSTTSPSAPVLFPIGTSGAYRPLQLTLANVTTAGSLIAAFVSSSPGSLSAQHLTDTDGNKTYNPFNDGYWTLTTNNSFASSSYSLNLTLNNFTAFTNSGFNGIDNGTRLLTRASSASSWTLQGNHVTFNTSNVNTVSRSGLFTLSGQYCLGDDTNCAAPSTSSITAASGTEVCNGSSGQVYSVSNSGGSTYTWSLSSGGSISSGQGTNSISAAWTSTGGTRTVSVVENNGCANGSTVSLNVNVHPIAPGAITGKANAPTNTSGTLSNETYSIATVSGYTYAWQIGSGIGSSGTIVTGQNTNSITVKWGAAGTDTVKVSGTYTGCSGSSPYTKLNVSVYSVIYSNRSTGNWDASNTWTCSCTPGASDNVVIMNGHTITVKSGSSASVKHLTINVGGTLNTSGALTVNGDFNLNGTLGGTGTLTLSSSVSSPVLDGVGSFSTTPITISSNRTINSTASLTQTASGSFTVAAGVTVFNYGSLVLAGSLTAGSTTSNWINGAASKLTVGGALFSSPAGTLTASATGNTVTYAGSVAQSNIKLPSSSYYNLIIANTGGSRTAPSGTLNIFGDFTNNSTSTLALPFDPNGGTVEFDATSTISGTATTTFNNITVANGASVTAPSSMNILGTLTNNGAFVHNGGTVNFSSAASAATAQISGSSSLTFYNLTVADGTAATDLINENSAGVNLINILNAGAATFDTDGAANNRSFTLLSTGDKPSVDASIAALTSATPASQFPGKITVQRFLSKIGVSAYNYQVWRDISAPVNSTVADLINSSKPSGLYLPVTGPFSGASTISGASGNSLFSYAENTTTDTNGDGTVNLNDGFTGFPSSTSATAFTAGQGYSIFIFGSNAPVSITGNAKFDLTGVPNAGSINLPVSYTAARSATVYNDGWNLVGNPYPSAIDWKAPSGWTKTNIDDAIYMDDYSTANPVFASYVNGVGTNGGTRYIGTGQGFWVKANAASPVLTISESVKSAGTQTTIFRQATLPDMLRVTLKTNSGLRDETVVYFLDSATTGFDRKLDARKLKNQYGYLNLSSMSAIKEKYAINGMPFSDCAQTLVSLDVSDVSSGTYSLSFSDFESMSPNMKIFLKDNLSNSSVDVRQNQTYSFNVDRKNASTFGSNRFSLEFTYQGSLVPITLPISNTCDPTQAFVKISSSSPDYLYSVLSNQGDVIVPPTSGTSTDLNLLISSQSIIEGTNTFLVKQINKFCSTLTSSATATITYEALPPIAVASSATSCGPSSLLITASGAPLDGSYNWYDSLSATISLYKGASFTTPVLGSTKLYYVTATNSLGCEGARTSVQATITSIDPALLATASPVSNCGPGSITLAAQGASLTGTYNWYDSLNAVAPIYSGLAFTTPLLSKTKTYYVAASNNTGCEGPRVGVDAAIVNMDAASVTVLSDLTTLQSNYTNGNQWYKDDVLIKGAIAQTYTPLQSGNYSVQVNSSGCTTTSAPVAFVVTGIEPVSDQGIRMYPNPVKGVLTIEVGGGEPAAGELYNPLGQRLAGISFSNEGQVQVARYDFTKNGEGMYLIKILQGGQLKLLKVVRE